MGRIFKTILICNVNFITSSCIPSTGPPGMCAWFPFQKSFHHWAPFLSSLALLLLPLSFSCLPCSILSTSPGAMFIVFIIWFVPALSLGLSVGFPSFPLHSENSYPNFKAKFLQVWSEQPKALESKQFMKSITFTQKFSLLTNSYKRSFSGTKWSIPFWLRLQQISSCSSGWLLIHT